MPLNWSVTHTSGSEFPDNVRVSQLQGLLDRLGDAVATRLAAMGLAPHASPLFRPFSVHVFEDAEKVVATFFGAQGMPTFSWNHRPTDLLPPAQVAQSLAAQLGVPFSLWVALPKPESATVPNAVDEAATSHVGDIAKSLSLGRLGDLNGVEHLETALRAFLEDHPEPDRNVFVIMRFHETDQFEEIHAAIRDALAARGLTAVRADDRDYTGEVWTNVQVYMTGCRLGIAVFEDIEERNFNPNVAVEVGYMIAKQKRLLLLKERRLPNMPTDVVHRLYRPFDVHKITETVTRQVSEWVTRDLRI